VANFPYISYRRLLGLHGCTEKPLGVSLVSRNLLGQATKYPLI
jgi:hypothetical protein